MNDNTLRVLRTRQFQAASIFGFLFGFLFVGGMAVLRWVGWFGYSIFALIATGIVTALELRLRHVRCPDCHRVLVPKPDGTPSQYRCPQCGIVWDTQFRKRG